MVPDAADLFRMLQVERQVPFPLRSVLAGAIATKLCPVDNHLQPPADAPAGSGAGFPQGLEDTQHDIGVVHGLHRQRADLGEDVSLEMVAPLLSISPGPAVLVG